MWRPYFILPMPLATPCWMSLSEGPANLIPICQRRYYVDSCEVCQSLVTVGIPLEHYVFLYDTY
jgi:hypothetical protein